MAREVAVDVIARDKASRTFSAVAGGADKARRSIGGLSSAFGTVAKTAAVAAGAAAIGGVVAVLKTGIDEARDFSAGQAQLAAGLKSTGNAAGISVAQMEALASSIQSYSGQTDDSIVASESLLLTFTKIRNQAGKNNDIFTQATKITADMAARMGGDAASKAVLLGKALNDPVKGITALTRVGVSFTQQQKDQIAALVRSGKTLDAQKVIIKELNTEFGGSAKAYGQSLPGQLARTKRAFEDVSQSIVTKALPYVTRFLGFINGVALPALAAMWGAFNGDGVTSDGFVGFMERVGVAARAVVDKIKQWWPTIQKVVVIVVKAVIVALQATVTFIRGKVIPAIQTAVQWVIKHWPQIANVFVVAWHNIQPTVMAFVNALRTMWTSVLQPIFNWIQAHWPQISVVVKGVFIALAVAAKVFLASLKLAFDAAAATIRVLATAFSWLYNNVWQPTVLLLITAGKKVGDGVKWAWDNIISPTIGYITAAWNGFYNTISTVAGAVSDAWKKIGDGLQWVYDHIIKKILDTIRGAINDIKAALDQINPFSSNFGIGSNLTKDAIKNAQQRAGQQPQARAFGGPVLANRPYVVGEKRPELFVPNQNGRIIPDLDQIGGKRVTINNPQFVVNYPLNDVVESHALPAMLRQLYAALDAV